MQGVNHGKSYKGVVVPLDKMVISNPSVEEVNLILEERLRTLQTERDTTVLNDVAQEVNGVLYEAITRYPTKVNAVRISTSISSTRERMGRPNYGERYNLQKFLQALRIEEVPESVDFAFVKHLPYSFTTGTHGSRERSAMVSSCETVTVVDGFDEHPTHVVIDLTDGGFFRENAYLFLDEIQSIRFEQVPDDQFTPRVEVRKGQYALEQSLSSAMHYVFFKGFYRYKITPEQIPQGLEGKDDVAAIVRDVFVPDNYSTLFKADFGASHRPVSFSGFAVDTSGKDPVLYEFVNMEIPPVLRNVRDHMVYAAHAIVQHRKNPSLHVQTYTGDDIIRKLSQIEVERRF